MWALVGGLCANFDPFSPENSFDKEIASFPIYIYIYIYIYIGNDAISLSKEFYIYIYRMMMMTNVYTCLFKFLQK